MIEMRRHLKLDVYPDGRMEPTYSSEYMRGLDQTFYATSEREPEVRELLQYTPTFMDILNSWISDFTRYLWTKKRKGGFKK
jgi:hypothetical protein